MLEFFFLIFNLFVKTTLLLIYTYNILSASTKKDKLASKRKEHRHKSEIFDRKRENDVSKMRSYEIKMIILKINEV